MCATKLTKNENVYQCGSQLWVDISKWIKERNVITTFCICKSQQIYQCQCNYCQLRKKEKKPLISGSLYVRSANPLMTKYVKLSNTIETLIYCNAVLESVRSFICVLMVSILFLSLVFRLNCRTIPPVWHFFVLDLIISRI